MELPSGLRLSFEDNPSRADRETIDDALGMYNAPFLADPRYSYFGLFARDGDERIRAGLIGSCWPAGCSPTCFGCIPNCDAPGSAAG
jgi:hypothetical protein